jgi:hypothetical protein
MEEQKEVGSDSKVRGKRSEERGGERWWWWVEKARELSRGRAGQSREDSGQCNAMQWMVDVA